MPDNRKHEFGGAWTEEKLRVLKDYLQSYTTALKRQRFRLIYIDAFAGTGFRSLRRNQPREAGLLEIDEQHNEVDVVEQEVLLAGSAVIALQTSPRFDSYIFVESNGDRCASLKHLKTKFADQSDRIQVIQGEANAEIRRICSSSRWNDQRAVLFLDPYGMQVEWPTLEAIAGTEAIDLWILFPDGIGANRLLTRSGEIPEAWQRRLKLTFGTDKWKDALYEPTSELTFWGEEESLKKAEFQAIGRFFIERLKTIFADVVDQPGVLRGPSHNPLYLLCFAAANKSGAPIAKRIANHLLKDLK